MQFGSKRCIYAIHKLPQLWKEVQAKRVHDLKGAPARSMIVLKQKNVFQLAALNCQRILPLRLRENFSWKLNMLKNLLRSLSLVWLYPWTYLTAFTSTCAKFIVYYSIRTYLFYFTYSLFKTSHIRLFILHYISLKYQIFLMFFSFFTHITTTIHPLPSSLGYVKKEKIQNE